MRRRHRVLDLEARETIVRRLRAAAASDEPIDLRTAALLSMTGPAQLLELVAPDRASARKHARRRIDHALDATDLRPIADSVRKVLADAAAAAAAGGSVAAMGAGNSRPTVADSAKCEPRVRKSASSAHTSSPAVVDSAILSMHTRYLWEFGKGCWHCSTTARATATS